MHPDYTHFPVLTGSSPALMTTPKQKKKKREKEIPSPIYVAHILPGVWSNSQRPVPLRKSGLFPPLRPLPPETINC